MDYAYPLLKSQLHHRYDPLFGAFKSGLSASLIGYPLSARSGYLKFILEYDKNFLSEFINPDKYCFILLENKLTGDELVHNIAGQLIALHILTPKHTQELESRLKMQDPHLTLITLQTALKSIYSTKRIVIILYEAEKILDNNPQAINFLNQIRNICRNQPDPLVMLCFIGSDLLQEKKQESSWSPLRTALEEAIIHFPLFDQKEMAYLKSRLESLAQTTIPDSVHKIAYQLSGGHTVLYRVLTQLSEQELQQVRIQRSHPAIDGLIKTIWDSIPFANQQKTEFPIPLLPPTLIHKEKLPSGITLPQLTAQQKIIFDHLIDHSNQIVSREEIGQIIWGKLWQEKYSDWAIDRSISNLKKRLLSTPYRLITLRNRGYKITI